MRTWYVDILLYIDRPAVFLQPFHSLIIPSSSIYIPIQNTHRWIALHSSRASRFPLPSRPLSRLSSLHDSRGPCLRWTRRRPSSLQSNHADPCPAITYRRRTAGQQRWSNIGARCRRAVSRSSSSSSTSADPSAVYRVYSHLIQWEGQRGSFFDFRVVRGFVYSHVCG